MALVNNASPKEARPRPLSSSHIWCWIGLICVLFSFPEGVQCSSIGHSDTRGGIMMRWIGQGWCRPTDCIGCSSNADSHALCVSPGGGAAGTSSGDTSNYDEDRYYECFRHGQNWLLDYFGTGTTNSSTFTLNHLRGIAVHTGPRTSHCHADDIYCVVYFSLNGDEEAFHGTNDYTDAECFVADVDVCATQLGNPCDVNANCEHRLNTTSCTCREGFVGNGTICQATTDPPLPPPSQPTCGNQTNSSCLEHSSQDCATEDPTVLKCGLPAQGYFLGGLQGELAQPCFPQQGCANHSEACSQTNWYELACVNTTTGYYLQNGERAVQCSRQDACAAHGTDCTTADQESGFLTCLQVVEAGYYLDKKDGIVRACQEQPNCAVSSTMCSSTQPQMLTCQVAADGYYLDGEVVAATSCADEGCAIDATCTKQAATIGDSGTVCTCLAGYCGDGFTCTTGLQEEGCFEHGTVCDTNRPGYLICDVACREQNVGCQIHGTACSTELPDRLVCTMPQEGYYLDGDVPKPCTSQTRCETDGTTCSIAQPTVLSCVTPVWGNTLEAGSDIVIAKNDSDFCTVLDELGEYCDQDSGVVSATELWSLPDHDVNAGTLQECRNACADYIQQNQHTGGCCTWRVRRNGYDWEEDTCTYYSAWHYSHREVPYGIKTSIRCGEQPTVASKTKPTELSNEVTELSLDTTTTTSSSSSQADTTSSSSAEVDLGSSWSLSSNEDTDQKATPATSSSTSTAHGVMIGSSFVMLLLSVSVLCT